MQGVGLPALRRRRPIDVAYSAGPYPDPPREIRSTNGKIYVHWRFYRDERQCATSGVDYFILDNAAGGRRQDRRRSDARPRPRPRRRRRSRRRAVGGRRSGRTTGGRPAAAAAIDDNPAHRAEARRRSSGEVAAAEGSRRAPAEPQPRRTPAGRPARRAAQRDRPRRAGGGAALVRRAGRGRHRAPAGDGGAPVQDQRQGASRKKAELRPMLADLAERGDPPTAQSVQLVTAAGLRAAIGKLPAGLDDRGSGQLYAAVELGKDEMLILILGQRGGWHLVARSAWSGAERARACRALAQLDLRRRGAG